MGLRITGTSIVESNLAKAQKDYDNSLEKLSSGVRFTRSEPMPAERARSDMLMAKMRELNIYNQNANKCGYYAWKPYIILDQLKKSEEGDIVFFRDCNIKKYPGILYKIK